MDLQRLSQNPQFLAVWFGLSYAYRVISLTFLTFLDNGGIGLMDPHTLLVSPLKKKKTKKEKKKKCPRIQSSDNLCKPQPW